MKLRSLALAACALSLSTVGAANAAGCLTGAAAGGVAGHFVGSGHAVLGAAGGCVVGHHLASKKAKEDAERAQAQQSQQAQQAQAAQQAQPQTR